MASHFISLLLIVSISAIVPLIAKAIPKQFIPETVLLIVSGALLGPHMSGLILSDSESIKFLSEMGCGFLFLLAGSEIDPKSLSGADGKHGLLSWIVSFIVGIVFAFIMPSIASGKQGVMAVGLLMTTTALGTLMPILKDKGIIGTRVGDLIISYGTWGELATVVAVAVLLSARSGWITGLILLLLFIICVVIGILGSKAVKSGSKLYEFIKEKAETNSQMTVRVVILLLVALITFSAVFDLDIVLGAFAAGFVLRHVLPEKENESLHRKLNGISYGFFVPLFFVVSGCGINLNAVRKRPMLMVVFILSLMLIRAVPIVLSLSFRKSVRKELSIHSRFSVAFYCTMALPLIVAITNIAVKNNIMEQDTASVLVAAGAATVFLMPLLGSLTYKIVDSETGGAIVEIAHDPTSFREIMRQHIELGHKKAHEYSESLKEGINNKIDSIENPSEKAEFKEIVKRHYEEQHNLTATQLHQQQKMHERHREEFQKIYSKYHAGIVGEKEFDQYEKKQK